MEKEKKRVILGVIGADVHAVGNTILNRALQDAGFEVTNLGVMVPQEEMIRAAVEDGADAILVSSLYGQGEIDCTGMREKCEEAGLKDILLYAGGKTRKLLLNTHASFARACVSEIPPPDRSW